MKQEFPTLVRVFDQTKIKKSYNLFRNLLKQAVMSDMNPEKIKKHFYPIFLPQQSCFKQATEVNKLIRDVSWKGKLVQNRHNNQKVFIRSFPCILQSDMPASKVSNISLMLVKSTESHTLSHISNSSYTESLSVRTFNGKHDDP